jgi:hypothetical protein
LPFLRAHHDANCAKPIEPLLLLPIAWLVVVGFGGGAAHMSLSAGLMTRRLLRLEVSRLPALPHLHCCIGLGLAGVGAERLQHLHHLIAIKLAVVVEVKLRVGKTAQGVQLAAKLLVNTIALQASPPEQQQAPHLSKPQRNVGRFCLTQAHRAGVKPALRLSPASAARDGKQQRHRHLQQSHCLNQPGMQACRQHREALPSAQTHGPVQRQIG